MRLKTKLDGFTLEVSDIRWLCQDLHGFSVGVSPNGQLLVVEQDPERLGLAAAPFQDFDDLLDRSRSSMVLEPPIPVLRKVAHALGITEIHGHPVDEYFPDDDEDDDGDELLLGVEPGKDGKARLVEFPARRREGREK